MIRDVLITKYPYVFWGMKQEKADVDLNKYILTSIKELKNGEERIKYDFKKFDKWKYLTAKYVPILVFLLVVFNRYDFIIDGSKLLEYLVSLTLTLIIFYTRRIYVYIAFALIIATSFLWIDSTAFLIKYTLSFVCIFSFIFDIDKNRVVFSILNSEFNTVANFYILERGKDDE